MYKEDKGEKRKWVVFYIKINVLTKQKTFTDYTVSYRMIDGGG